MLAGTTEDGLAGPPTQVSMKCRHDNVSGMNFVDVTWQHPIRPGGQIEFYNVIFKHYLFVTMVLAKENPILPRAAI